MVHEKRQGLLCTGTMSRYPVPVPTVYCRYRIDLQYPRICRRNFPLSSLFKISVPCFSEKYLPIGDDHSDVRSGGRGGERGCRHLPAEAVGQQPVGILPVKQEPQGTGNKQSRSLMSTKRTVAPVVWIQLVITLNFGSGS